MDVWKGLALTFLLSCASAFALMAARLGYSISTDLPPEDPALFKAWRRKRLWTLVAEISTIPAMGAAITTASAYWQWPAVVIVGASMAAGALGFGFLLDALQRMVTRRIENA